MDIAIIGSGMAGTIPAVKSAAAGHRVTLSARDPEHAKAAAEKAGRWSSSCATSA